MCLVAMLCWWWQPGLYSPWVIGAALLLAVLAEVAEGLSSAAGSARSGGTRALVLWLGGRVDRGPDRGVTVLIPIPVVGSIIGGILGAGAGAVIGERGVSQRTWADSWRRGAGRPWGGPWRR